MAETEQTAPPSFADEQIPLTHLPSQPQHLEPGQDNRLIPVEMPFSGAWVPDEDPLKIGLYNFADLQNYRYSNSGLVGVAGYSRITTTPLGAAIQNGIQFLKMINGTQRSYVLAQSAAPNIYPNTAVVPAAGDFGTALLASEAGGGLGRFALWPDGTVALCDGANTLTWSTPEHRVAAFINYDGLSNTFRYDYTGRVTNTLTDSANLAYLMRDATPDIWLLIGATRPLQGIKFYMYTANTSASTTTVEYWNGGWTTVGAVTDGTAVGGVTLAQTGTLSFATTVSVAHVSVSDGRALYWYRVKIGATGTPDSGLAISHCTVDAPMQPVVDIWDGVERNPIYAAQGTQDFTLEVQQPSPVKAPQALVINGTLSLKVVFEERMQALRFTFNGGHTNIAVAAPTVSYWNGSTYASVGTLVDTTTIGGVMFNVPGTLAWQPPVVTSEVQLTEQVPPGNQLGVTGFSYLITASADLGAGLDVLVDTITGIPAPRWEYTNPAPGYRFPFSYGGRAMLASRSSSNEPNRVDYSAPGQPDVWNGTQASSQGKALYIGTAEPLTCALELSNRYAGVATQLAFALKNSETWILQGSTPDTFTQYRLSDQVGCPAPLTLCLAEIPAQQDFEWRTVALWCSAKGPVMSNGSVIIPLRFEQGDRQISSVEAYFNPDDSRYVNTTYWEKVAGWYDAQHSEYNLVLPSGSATTCNTWLVCDLLRRKWYRKVPSAYPQCGWQVKDALGTTAVYAGLTTGHLLRLEYGTTWDGANITHLVDTADIILPLTRAEGSFWEETLIRYLKVLALAESGTTVQLTCQHAPNGTGTFTTFTTLSLAVSGGRRWNRQTVGTNLRSLSHQFRFSATTSAQSRAPRLLGFGALARTERLTLNDATS